MSSVGERVLEIRKDAKLTQISFAKQIGISQTHVSKIEKGVEHPSQTLIKYISYSYTVNEERLKTGKCVMSPAADSAENDLVEALKRFETNVPCQFKDGDVMAIAQILNLLYNMLTIEMPQEKYNKPSHDWFEFPARYIDEIFYTLASVFSIVTKAYEYNTEKIDSEYLARFVKNASESEAKHLIEIVHKLTTIPMEQLLQQ